MNKREWKNKIKKACMEAQTYRRFFDPIIDQLAELLEIRDSAIEQFKLSGGNPVVAHTNKGGHTNLVKNPALAVLNDCSQQALAYWRDLGLTPAGYKKLNGEVTEKRGGSFEAAIQEALK